MASFSQAVLSAPSIVGSALTAGGSGGQSWRAELGMTMWFKVAVDGLGDLGEWSACSGLGVKLNTEPVKETINHDHPRFVPLSLSYGDITIERAMTETGAKLVRSWLGLVTRAWVNGQEGGAPGEPKGFEGTTVTITLYSALRAKPGTPNVIAEWRLVDAYPVAWTGPSLSSKSSDVAIEKLTIAHSGFLDSGTSTAPRRPEPSGQGLLRLSYDGTTLPLQYNPEKVTMNKQVTIKDESKGPTYVRDEQITEPGKLSIAFEARVEGATAVDRATGLLWEWLEPLPSSGGASPSGTGPTTGGNAKTGANNAKPKVLVVQLGAQLERTAILKQVNTTFTRFTRAGAPCRATISITLEETNMPPQKTNPTSGSPPGGRVHTVTEGETLPVVAANTYGSPGAWREVAEHNGIDDPLRLRNGSPLYLPGA